MLDTIRGLTPTTLFGITVALGAVFLGVANFKDDTGEGGTGAFIFSVALTAAVSAFLLFRLWDRLLGRAGYWSLVFGVVGFLSLVVFWSGFPFVFGVAAVALGARAPAGETRARVGLGLGLLSGNGDDLPALALHPFPGQLGLPLVFLRTRWTDDDGHSHLRSGLLPRHASIGEICGKWNNSRRKKR